MFHGKESKTTTDIDKKAFSIVQLATGEDDEISRDGKNPTAVALGRLGELKGGKARASSLTAEQRSEIAKKAVVKR